MAAVNFQPLFCWWCWFFYMRILITRRPCCSTWDGLLLSKWSKYLLHWKLELVCDWYFRCVRRNIGLRDWWIISAVRRETLTSWWVDYLYEEKLLFYFWMESWRQLQSLRIFLFKLFFSPVIYICLYISMCSLFVIHLVLNPLFPGPGCLHAVHQHCCPLCWGHELPGPSTVWVHKTGVGWQSGGKNINLNLCLIVSKTSPIPFFFSLLALEM